MERGEQAKGLSAEAAADLDRWSSAGAELLLAKAAATGTEVDFSEPLSFKESRELFLAVPLRKGNLHLSYVDGEGANLAGTITAPNFCPSLTPASAGVETGGALAYAYVDGVQKLIGVDGVFLPQALMTSPHASFSSLMPEVPLSSTWQPGKRFTGQDGDLADRFCMRVAGCKASDWRALFKRWKRFAVERGLGEPTKAGLLDYLVAKQLGCPSSVPSLADVKAANLVTAERFFNTICPLTPGGVRRNTCTAEWGNPDDPQGIRRSCAAARLPQDDVHTMAQNTRLNLQHVAWIVLQWALDTNLLADETRDFLSLVPPGEGTPRTRTDLQAVVLAFGGAGAQADGDAELWSKLAVHGTDGNYPVDSAANDAELMCFFLINLLRFTIPQAAKAAAAKRRRGC